jgi:long-chain fatty acid transport protein
MTTIGIGYRSAIEQKLNNGSLISPLTGVVPASTTVNLPDTVSLGIRQRLDPQWLLLGTIEWTNWSRIGTPTISGPLLPPAFLNLPLQYKDGWLFSVGAEYLATDRLTLRTGFGYEISPITDQVRTPLIPDNDRIWASVGATWEIMKGMSANLAYSHLFVRSTSINISAASGNPWFATTGGVAYIGDVQSHVDILSLGLKIRWDDLVAAPNSTLYHK